MHSQSFTDAQGWNLTENYSTLQTAVATVTENNKSHARTLVLGRGSKGLEVYKFTGQWGAAADSNFPQYCTNFNTDGSPKCLAYKAISNRLGQVNIRSQYTQASFNKGNWTGFQGDVNSMSNPNGSNSDPNWQTVHIEMVDELGYVATVRGWFDNNYNVINYTYTQNVLQTAVSDVDFATTKSVVAKWVEMGADIVSKLAAFIPNGGGAPISLMITIIEDAYNNLTANTGGDIDQAITKLIDQQFDQENNLAITNAQQQTAYLTDYSKLQQIGKDHSTGGYDWANASLDALADAKVGAALGMLLNYYRMLLPYKWYVNWCEVAQYGGLCGSIYTPARYDCQYGSNVFYPSLDYGSQAYLYAGFNYDVNWGLADKVTGVGNGDVNAIWYMMLLGSDLGWDLPAYQVSRGNQPGSDPTLAWDNLNNGAPDLPKNAGCYGNGSTTGIQGSFQTLSQRLTIVQQNTRHITASEANRILELMRTLKQDAKAASPDDDTEINLTSPLREAAKLIERAKRPGRHLGQEGSVSATTPTHFTELFVQRAQIHAHELGQPRTEYLLTKAYELIAELEGQNQPGKPAVARCSR